MSFRKVTVVLSGGGANALVRLSGVLDGVGKVKVECGGAAIADGRLWLVGDEITEIELKRDKKTYETRFSAQSDIKCLLSVGGKTLTGGSGEKVDRLAIERRVAAYDRRKTERMPSSDGGRATDKPSQPRETPADKEDKAEKRAQADGGHKTAYRDGESVSGGETLCDGGRSPRDCPPPRDGECGERRADNVRSARESRMEGVFGRENRGAGAGAAGAADGTDVNVRSVLEEGVTYDGTNFFYAVKPQLDEMFVRYPAEERLNAIVPNSKWVRVDTDEGDYYVLGVLYDLSTPIFICYGIPGMRNVAPPREIADVCVWLPLSADEPDGGGFWIIYQSAENGKCVR